MSTSTSTHGHHRPGTRPRRARNLLAALLATLLVVGTVAVGGATAGATSAPQPGRIVSDDPANWTPHALDGYVTSFAEVGNLVVAGGNFTQVRTASSSTAIPRSYLFVFQKDTGAITSVAPVLNGEVRAIVPAGDGRSVFVGGGFNTVDGQTVRSLFKLDVTTGQRVTQFNPPAFNGRVHDLALRNGKLWVMGRFTTVANQPQTLVAAVDATTGANDPNANITFADPRNGGELSILAGDVTPDGSKMVAIGNFTTIAGLPRYQIGVLDLTTTPISVANWSTGLYGNGCSSSFDSYMRGVDIAPDGRTFAVVTTGAYNTTYLCDTAASWDLTATGSSLKPLWANYTGGDTITDVAVTRDVTYIGGHFSYMNNPYVADSVSAGAAPREALAALDNRSGAVLSWNPTRERGYGVYGFTATDSGLWIGSDTDLVKGEYHGKLAFMPLAGGVKLPDENVGALPAQVVSLGLVSGTSSTLDRVRSRTMGVDGATSATTTSNGTFSWRNSRGAFMVDGKLYTGWSDRTFKVQDFDGTTFGPQTTVPLRLVDTVAASLNRFSTEDLSTVSGMFYDRTTGRLYFARTGSRSLSYRSFSPESLVVGATRVDSAASAGGIDWRNVRSMFLADGYLFYADSNTGNLYRRTWDPAAGLPTGSAVLVGGPSKDGQDWRARGAFVFAPAGVSTNQPPVASFTSSCTGATCGFDATGSTDADGTVSSYSWNFGDGTAPGIGASASHAYATSGTYTVTLTVTDDDGASATTTRQVAVTVPNVAPTASFTSSCTGLTCTFDGTGSVDPDGTITSYAWNFGDGGSATGATASRTFAAGGTFQVSLTVTDNSGASRTTSSSVTVVDPNVVPTVVFRAASGTNTNSTSVVGSIPAATAEGDVLVAIATVNNTDAAVTAPAGWTLLASGSDPTATEQTFAWTRTATATDAGRAVTVGTSVTSKTTLQVLAYDGASGVSAATFAFDTVSRADRTTPSVNVTTPGSRLVSYWADKSSLTTGWTLPAGVTLRDQQVGSGSGRVVAAVADSGPLAAGPAGGLTATADSANRRGVVWSIVVAADTSAPNVPPTPSFTTNCSGLTCSVDATASTDPDGTIASYAWNFGDGGTGTGATASRTYAAAGTYTVSLTVTDDKGAANTTTRQVTVAPVAKVATFRSANGVSVNSTAPAVTVPADVQAGDLLVLIATVNNADTAVNAPAGWTQVGSGVDPASMQSVVWTRTATAADAGATVTVGTPVAGSKTALQVMAYKDASSVTASALAFETTQRQDHTTPLVNVATGGSALISYWADKSSATTTWTAPAGTVLRNLVAGPGSGRIVAAVADNGSLAAGTAGGLTAVADSASRRAAMWSIVVAPSA